MLAWDYLSCLSSRGDVPGLPKSRGEVPLRERLAVSRKQTKESESNEINHDEVSRQTADHAQRGSHNWSLGLLLTDVAPKYSAVRKLPKNPQLSSRRTYSSAPTRRTITVSR
jgi:hypothetical protein